MSQETIDADLYTLPFQLTPTVHRNPQTILSYDKPENAQDGKVICITGGGTGIGAAAAEVWVRAGAHGVIIAGRRLDRLQNTESRLKEISTKTIVVSVQTDVTVPADVEILFATIYAKFGRAPDVVLANAGAGGTLAKIGDREISEVWNELGVNIKGLYTTIHYYIKSLPDRNDPSGTVIAVSSGAAGSTIPGMGSYSVGKLAGQRLIEYVHAEYPNLRAFTVIPGVVATEMMAQTGQGMFSPFAKDDPYLVGLLALYLVQAKADYLRGQLVSVNWDIEEMERSKEAIEKEKLLQVKWHPILPIGGGEGLSSAN